MLLVGGRTCRAGEYTFIASTKDKAAYAFTGEVTEHDSETLETLALYHTLYGQDLVIHIDSPGGLAYEGVELYWMAKKWGVHTVAGNKYGAYSAAGLFWLGGGDNATMTEGSIVGFHLAYCNPYNPPGCWTADIDGEIQKCLIDALGRQGAHDLNGRMLRVLDLYGAMGFVLYEQRDGQLIIRESIPSPKFQYAPLLDTSGRVTMQG